VLSWLGALCDKRSGLSFVTKTERPGPRFYIPPSNGAAQLDSQAPISLFVASYPHRARGRSILTRLYTDGTAELNLVRLGVRPLFGARDQILHFL
jgi:hypothetical protein